MRRAILMAILLSGFAFQAPAQPPGVGVDNSTDATALHMGRHWRLTKLVGKSFTNMQDQTVGTIEDVVVDNDGKVVAVLVSVGGFLGLGKRRVAVAFKDLLISRAEDGDPIVKVTLSRQALETAPDAEE